MRGINKYIYYKTEENWNKKNYSPNPIKEPKAGVSKKYISNIDDSLFSDLQCEYVSIFFGIQWSVVNVEIPFVNIV